MSMTSIISTMMEIGKKESIGISTESVIMTFSIGVMLFHGISSQLTSVGIEAT